MSNWPLTTYANPNKETAIECGRELHFPDFFPEHFEEKERLKPSYWIEMDEFGDATYYDAHEIVFNNESPCYPDESNHSDKEYVAAYDVYVEECASKCECVDYMKRLWIETDIDNISCQSSPQTESMSAIRQFGYHKSGYTDHFSCRRAWKEYQKENHPKPARSRDKRCRGRRNPPRLRKERQQKLELLFAEEHHWENISRWKSFE